jgi:hypothetical protein
MKFVLSNIVTGAASPNAFCTYHSFPRESRLKEVNKDSLICVFSLKEIHLPRNQEDIDTRNRTKMVLVMNKDSHPAAVHI